MRRKLMLWLPLAWIVGAQPADAATALDALVLSPGSGVTLDLAASGEEVVAARSAVRYSPGGAALVPLGLPVPPGGLVSDIEAFHEAPDGSIYFSLSAPETLSGIDFEPRDVIRWDGSSHTRHFHGLAKGVPIGVAITSFAQDASGTDLLSFAASFSVGPTSITPLDVVAWPDGAAPGLWLQTALTGVDVDVVAIDGLTLLGNGRALLSFASDGVVAGVERADEDVLEYDPASGSWELAVDTSDLDPDWASAGVTALDAKLGPGNVGVPEPVRVRMLHVDAFGFPKRYALRLGCGPHRVRDIAFGVVIAPGISLSSVSIGPCSAAGCASVPGGPQFGPSVDAATAVVDFSPEPPEQRADAIYLELDGAGGGLLCQPGEEVLLAEVEIAGATGSFLSAPPPTGEGAGDSHYPGAALLPERLISHSAGSASPVWSVIARPASGDASGLLYELVLESNLRFHRLGVALLLPEGVSAAQVSFGGCDVVEEPDVQRRSCAAAGELGPYVDPAASYTLGPAAGLAALGGHPGAIYVNLQGAAPTGQLPALNFAGKPTLLGRLRYDGSLARLFTPLVWTEGFDPDDLLILDPQLTDGSGQVETGGGSGETSSSQAGDSDGDGLADDVDNCVGSSNVLDQGGIATTAPDGIGDDCQCGDVTNVLLGPVSDGIVDQSDVTGIRWALTGAQGIDPGLADKCSVRGSIDANPSPLGLRSDCELSDSVVLRRVLDGATVIPSDLQECAAP